MYNLYVFKHLVEIAVHDDADSRRTLVDGCLFCERIIQIDIVCVMLRSRQVGQCIHMLLLRDLRCVGYARASVRLKLAGQFTLCVLLL